MPTLSLPAHPAEVARSQGTPTGAPVYVHRFADLVKRWLAEVDHPGIDRVRTCAEIGWWEQPVGLVLDLTDGWRFILQTVGASPDGGDRNRDPDDERPAPFDGDWQHRPDYQTNRAAFEAEVKAWSGPVAKRPQATVSNLLAVVVEAVKRADHPKVASVDITDGRPAVRVVFTDGSRVHGLAAGYLPPGTKRLAHKAHEIPEEWR